jgi:ubiquinone/menaquinone biosynthesis C-methylase UbiE
VLPRILEPEVMDSADEARDYDAMDHAAVNRAFVADFLAAWDGGAPVLDVGTGTAQIPIELCRHHPTVQITAIDLAEHMLAVGRDNLRRAALDKRIVLERQDAKRLPYPDGAFEAVISNNIVHHIPMPGAVLAEMARVTRKDELLFVRDLLRPDDDATLRRLVDLYAVGANGHQRQMYADSLHAALTLAEVRGLVAALGYDPAGVQQTTDRHWTWVSRKR